MNKIITEITPLAEKDCFYLVDRLKDQFNYPIHRHKEYELNFVAGCAGSRRVVGDSIEELGEYDLALLGGSVEHTWEQHACASPQIREITIQFSDDLFGGLLEKNQFTPIRVMLDKSAGGIAFSMPSIMRVYSKLDDLTRLESGFYRVIKFFEILYDLAVLDDYRRLSSSSFANSKVSVDSRRVRKVQEYIDTHYKEDLHLALLSDLVGMTDSAFSRFFRLRTGRSITEYITEIRLGHAARMLVDSTMGVSEICYECGFNNVSNFNRLFKRLKGRSPREFREVFKRHKSLV